MLSKELVLMISPPGAVLVPPAAFWVETMLAAGVPVVLVAVVVLHSRGFGKQAMNNNCSVTCCGPEEHMPGPRQ